MSAALLVLLAATAVAVGAAEEEPFCATLVTAAELEAIAPGFEPMRARRYSEGHSECSWMLGKEGAGGTVSMTFFEPAGLEASMFPAESPAELYDMFVSSTVDGLGEAAEPLPGVGERSALFREEGTRTVYVLTPAGVGYLIAGGLDDAKVIAVAAAMAAP